jgi:hypothetical protein
MVEMRKRHLGAAGFAVALLGDASQQVFTHLHQCLQIRLQLGLCHGVFKESTGFDLAT